MLPRRPELCTTQDARRTPWRRRRHFCRKRNGVRSIRTTVAPPGRPRSHATPRYSPSPPARLGRARAWWRRPSSRSWVQAHRFATFSVACFICRGRHCMPCCKRCRVERLWHVQSSRSAKRRGSARRRWHNTSAAGGLQRSSPRGPCRKKTRGRGSMAFLMGIATSPRICRGYRPRLGGTRRRQLRWRVRTPPPQGTPPVNARGSQDAARVARELTPTLAFSRDEAAVRNMLAVARLPGGGPRAAALPVLRTALFHNSMRAALPTVSSQGNHYLIVPLAMDVSVLARDTLDEMLCRVCLVYS